MSQLKFIRDPSSKAVLNTNRNALDQYKLARLKKVDEQQSLQRCINDINILKDDMQEIKNLLLKLSEN